MSSSLQRGTTVQLPLDAISCPRHRYIYHLTDRTDVQFCVLVLRLNRRRVRGRLKKSISDGTWMTVLSLSLDAASNLTSSVSNRSIFKSSSMIKSKLHSHRFAIILGVSFLRAM
mmetsp:Transcript_13043/g.19003  ORF Transcript_13043/g.19003 Transcript_13043/m.19003 type:complete len:114 (-) Transcript_13043:59-400(-)